MNPVSFFVILIKNTGPENWKMDPVSRHLHASSPKMFQIVICAIIGLSWKFHKNLFIHFAVMSLTDTLLRLDGRPWNSLVRCETVELISLVLSPTFHENFIKIRMPIFSWYFQQSQIQKIEKSILYQGVNCNISKMFQIVPCLMCNLCWKFHENLFIHFHVVLLTGTDFPKNVEKDFLCLGG